MRNRYTKEFEEFVRKNSSSCTKEELIQLIQREFNIEISKDILRRYMNRHSISKCLDYKKYNVRNVYKCKVGAERKTKEGVFIKVAHPDIWRRKSRVMYEKYHNCKLEDNEYVVFLNQNNEDFSKDNLVKSTRQEIAYLHNNKTFSSNPKLTELGMQVARFMIRIKEIEGAD